MGKVEYNLNLIGLKCPLPVLKISKKFKEIKIGDIINAKCDDPKSENDINNLCKSIRIKLIKKKSEKEFIYFKLMKI
jgi:TusA-related sulfurtransferase|tara:strand:+ start:4200 stop:4430 length:231 start_codon:yes stop_codon:yes gene_type:complete